MARRKQVDGKALRAKLVGQARQKEPAATLDPEVACVMDWVGRNLASLRQARGWTQTEAADALGADVKAIRRAESGTANLTIASVVTLARRYGVPVASLFSEPGDLSPRKPGRPRRAKTGSNPP